MPDHLRGLRRAVLATLLSGLASTAVGEALPLPLVAVAAVGAIVGAELAARSGEALGRRLRQGATVAVAGLAAVMLPGALGVGQGGPRDVLGPLLVGVAALQTLTWRSRRDLQGGLLAALGLLVLGASYAPDILVGLPLVLGWVTALVACALVPPLRSAESADGRAVSSVEASSTRAPVVAATSLAAVLGLVAFLLVPAELAGSAVSPLSSFATGGNAPSGKRSAFGSNVYTGNRIDMRLRGDLTEEPVAEVPAASPGLWRGTLFDRYDGFGWTSGPTRTSGIAGPPYVVVPNPAAATRRDEVRIVGPTDGTLFSPGAPVAVEARTDAVTVDRLGNVTAPGARQYVVTSEGPRADAADADDRRWLQLPPRLPPRVGSLARTLTAGATSPTEAARAVEIWLRANATYRTDSPVPGFGEDAVDRFLFVDKTGFCEQFAAAHAVLLRSVGIPTRFVAGLAYGVDGDDGRRTFRQKDQHTWIEVFQPGVGWVAFDPTADTVLATGAGGFAGTLRTRVARSVEATLRSADRLPGGRPALAGVLLALTALVALVRPWRPHRRSPVALRSGANLVAPGPALAAFLRFDDRLGPLRRWPSESLAELAARLGPGPASALAVVEEECYAAVPPPDADRAAELLDRLPAPASAVPAP